MQMLRNEILKSLSAKIGYLLARPAFQAFKKRVDYAEYGGAPLLGINGTGIVCHGKSSAQAIKNAILEANKMVQNNVNTDILKSLAADGNDRADGVVMGTVVLGTGSCLPAKIVTNHDLENIVETY